MGDLKIGKLAHNGEIVAHIVWKLDHNCEIVAHKILEVAHKANNSNKNKKTPKKN